MALILHETQIYGCEAEKATWQAILHVSQADGNQTYPIEGWALKPTARCPEGHLLRPHVVWFWGGRACDGRGLALHANGF
jgi:hypothetical protein